MKLMKDRDTGFFIVVLVLVFVYLIFLAPAHATDRATATAEASSGDQIVKGDSSKAFGFGMGDVDIAQCYRSYSVLVWQDSKPNLLCVADSLDAKGLHDAAAKTRCAVKRYAKVFDSVDQCISLSTMKPAPAEPMPEITETEDVHEEQIVAQQQEIDYVKEELAAVQKRLTYKPKPQVIPYLTEEKKAKLREVVK